jgi:hypothetical protein
MTEPIPVSPIDLLVLTRLLPAGEKGAKTADIKKDLEPLLGHRWSGTSLTSVLERTLLKLSSSGLVTMPQAKTKRSAPLVQLTPEGYQKVLAFLNVSHLPTKPKVSWSNLKKSLLLARALGLPAPGAGFSRDDGFRAALLKLHYGLPLADYPVLKQAKVELTRELLGMGPNAKITLETVQAAIFCRELGDYRTADPKKALDRLLSVRLRARRDDPKEFREEVLRSWIEDSLGPSQLDLPSPHPHHLEEATSPPAFLDLAMFARRVQDVARSCPAGRFGDNKVFVSHVWRALEKEPEFHDMGLDAFKHRLAEANNARLLDLGRADLVQAMDPHEVQLSEVSYLSATFHFIRVEQEKDSRQ